MSDICAIGHYTALEVARLAGVSPRRIGQWARYGIIPSSGRGERVYTYADAAEAILAHYLVEQGLHAREVRMIVQNLRKEYGNWPLTTAPIEHEGRLVVVREGRDVYFDVVYHVQQKVIAGTLDLKAVRDALERGGWVALKKPREHIEVNPERLSGRPTIRGRRLATEVVAELAAEKDGPRLLHDEFGLTKAEINEAVAYENDVLEALAA